MLRVTPSVNSAAAKQYFGKGLTRDDYYLDGQEIAGTWGGKGAKMLGLEGWVDAANYFALCDNVNPQTGERLTPRSKDNRRVGFDFTFSAPKTVSVLYELSGDERILDAFHRSVEDTMAEVEREMKTRERKAGADNDRITGNMVWAAFTHFTARPVNGLPDPHLHEHCFAFNTTFDDAEGRWKAGQFGDLKRDASYFEAAFDARLAYRLNALGYATAKGRRYSFEIAGVPNSVVDKFSQRRNAIEQKAAAMGIDDPLGKHAIGYREREHKTNDIGRAELRNSWNARLSDAERTALTDAIHAPASGDRAYTAEEAKEYALSHSFQNASTVSEKRLKAEALKYGVGSVLPEDVADITKHHEVIAKAQEGQVMTTTKSVLKDEIAMLQFARDGQRRCRALIVASGVPEAALEGLSNEQKEAALHVLGSRDQVTGISGKAGTGKTRMMRTTIDAIHAESDKKVFVFAPSSQASRGVLKKEGFRDAETLEMLLRNEKLQEQVRGQVIWLDEAGLVSSRDMKRLMDMAKRTQARVILSGDYTQHASVEAGDAFRLLEKEAGVKLARLTEVRRQTAPAYKKAVESVAQGTGKMAQKGFDALDRMGCVIEASGEQRHRMLVADYLNAVGDGKTGLIIAPTHAEGGRLSDALRAALKEGGALGKEREFIVRKSDAWTDAQKSDLRNYETGMVVEFHQNVKGFTRGEKAVVIKSPDGSLVQKRDGTLAALPVANPDRFEVYRPLRVAVAKGDRIRITRNGESKPDGQAKGTRLNNGDVFTVEGFDKKGNIRLEKGKVLSQNFGHFTLGYVDTSYASQGKTVDRVFIATGRESLVAANQQQWYVSITRGRELAKVYVENKQEVRDAIARTGQRLSAVELTHTALRPSWRERFRQSLERSRAFVKARAEAVGDYWRGKEGRSYA